MAAESSPEKRSRFSAELWKADRMFSLFVSIGSNTECLQAPILLLLLIIIIIIIGSKVCTNKRMWC